MASGGGTNKTVQSRSGGKVEPISKAGNLAGVGQVGLSHAFKPDPMLQGKGYEPAKMGAVDRPSYKGPSVAAPGSNRTIYPSGFQAKTPAAKEMPAGREILSEYGPDSITARGRR